jgi:glycosyltransferase involved in cell wall biosynthesis
MKNMVHVGVVVIGRNEEERLKQCLQSITNQVDKVVYVDSGSSDSSLTYAESIDVEVVQLDTSTPFSAGRARNEGFQRLVDKYQELEFIQFIDGDCELCKAWLFVAYEFLVGNPSYAIVAGQRRERYPERSIYNLLCDIEWNTPVGETKSCGGDFMVRKTVFLDAKGFNPNVVAGEEPELCYRLRKNRWQIYRIDHLMTMHDAAINHFSQWWRRAIRSGHAYAQGYALHGSESEKYCLRDSLRIWFWALVVPGLILLLAIALSSWWLLLFSAYIALFIKIALNINKRLLNWKHSFYYALFNIIGKWPQLIGQLLFIKRKLLGHQFSIVEYR